MKKIAVFAPVAVALLGVTAPALAQSSAMKAQLESRFKAADVNKDGKLTKKEAEDGGMTRIASNFATIDADKDGFVSMADIEKTMASRGQ